MENKILGSSIKDRVISKTKFVTHILRNVSGFRKIGTKIMPVKMNTEVIILPDGGQVIPYFKDRKGKWKIVLVSQYRAAVKEKTIEGAGGRSDDEIVKVALSRELKEEVGVKIMPSSLRIVFREYIHPPITNAVVYGGIVKIYPMMVVNKKMAGMKNENEWTQVEIFDLIEILRKRDNGLMVLDLLTSRLIDEVAKAVGLLVKKY